MAASRKKRRVTRRADAELQEAERAFEGGSRLKALQHYQSALGTMRELNQDEWSDEDKIRVMKAYVGSLENMPETVDMHAEDVEQDPEEEVVYPVSVITVPNPELVATKNQAQEFLNTQPDIASLDYFITKIQLVMCLVDLTDLEDLAQDVLEERAGDSEFVAKHVGEIISVLDSMYVALEGQDIEALLTEKQREVLVDAISALAHMHLIV